MAGYTQLDEIVDYSHKIINKIILSPDVMRLIANTSDYDPNSDDAERWEAHVNDRNWIEDTIQAPGAYILVDAELTKAPTGSIKNMTVSIQVVCEKSFMQLTNDIFPGIKGNRRDNICRQTDLLINGSRDFGIGRLNLVSATLASAPEGFTSRVLTYEVPDFARDRARFPR